MCVSVYHDTWTSNPQYVDCLFINGQGATHQKVSFSQSAELKLIYCYKLKLPTVMKVKPFLTVSCINPQAVTAYQFHFV